MSYKTLSSDKVSTIVNRMGIYLPTQELEAFVNTMDDVAGANKDAVEDLVQRAEISASEAQQDADTAFAAAQVAANEANKAKGSADLAEQARLLGASIGYATKALMDANLAHPEGTLALVTNDGMAANNGTYRKTGVSGAGSWEQSADRVTALGVEIKSVAQTLYSDVQRFGYPDGEIPDGTSAAGSGSYTITTPVSEEAGRIRFACYARAAGTVYVQVVSRAGDTNTIISEAAVPVVIGYNEATVNLPCSTGQYVGFRALAGIVAITSGSPGYSYWSGAGVTGPGSSYVDATASSNIIFHARLYLGKQVVTGDSFYEVRQELDSVEKDVGSGTSTAAYWVGGQGSATPVTGSVIGHNTYVAGTPAPTRWRAVRVRAFVHTPGTITLRKFSRVGNTFNAVGDDLVVDLTYTGVVEVPITAKFVLDEGEFYGITKSAGVVSVVSAAAPDGYYRGGADATSFIDASPEEPYTIQLSVEFEPYTLHTRVSRLEAAPSDPTDALRSPDGYIVVWGLGESHMAGRGESASSTTIPAGVAYKYVRASGTIEHMVDPAGADGSANGSIGPALADTLWRMSNGALGVIFINSGLGSSRIGVGWASGGSGWTDAVSDWVDAVAKISALKLPVSGVGVLLAIGSNDAAASTTGTAFKSGVVDLLARCRGVIGGGDSVPMILMQTGDFTDGSYATEVQVIRQAQAELVEENAGIFMGWTGAKTFVDRGLMRDNVHYTQFGNDIAGRAVSGVMLSRSVGYYPSGLD